MKSSSAFARSLFVAVSAGLLAFAAIRASATQVTLPVITSSSTLAVTVCAQPSGMSQSCSTDTPNLSGSLTVSLDNNGAPTAFTLRNYSLQATRDVSLHLSWVFGLATVTATATGLQLVHPSPGPQNPFYAVSGGAFTLGGLPFKTYGTANYTANSVACAGLPSGQACTGTIDLSQNGPGTVTNAPGTVQINNGVATVHLDFTFSQPLDFSNPTFGTMTVHAIVNASGAVPPGLVPFGSDWRYLDNGTDQNTAWRAASFDDSGWAIGPAQLGYGDGDEATTNSFGSDPANKYITTYYRHAFNVANPALYTNLVLRLLRDDGAVVFLNGAEIFRSNMPTGAVNYLTLAASTTAGASENLYFAQALSAGLLLAGRNVLAVEVHQDSPSSSDISFDLELQGNFTFSNQLPVVAITSPTNGSVVANSGFVLEATATDPDGVITLVEFFQNGLKIGEAANAPYTVTVPSQCPGTFTFTARAWDNSAQSSTSVPATITMIRPTMTLVAKGADWKYLDTGLDPGAGWKSNTFNDSAWLHGPAQLGYGDGDEATTVGFGPDGNNKYITTYFRHPFVLTNLTGMLGVMLQVLRDDGVVVYLNGAEVFRNNMPTGAVTMATLAVTNVGGVDETTHFYASAFGTNFLRTGTNIIAAEVHQSGATSSDLSFDLELDAGYPNQTPVVVITSPAPGEEIPAGASVLVHADAADLDGQIAKVQFFLDSNKIAELVASPYEFLWSSPPAGQHTLTALAYDDCGAVANAPSVTVTIGMFDMVRHGAVWKYLDNGSNLGVAWRALAYPNDASWKSGPAKLGYGIGDEATVVGYGSDANNKYITTYFRRAWVVPDKSVITNLTLRLLRDDGAVVYLNGTEIYSNNMPSGTYNYLTLATTNVSGADETNWVVAAVSPASLRDGTNVLAVEIHQVSATNSDICFDLELAANVRAQASQVEIVSSGSSRQVRWPSWAVGYQLYRTDSLTSPVWILVPAPVADDGAWKSVTIPTPATNGFYRLAF